MTSNSPRPAEADERRLQQSRDLIEALARALHASIRSLADGTETHADARARQEMFRTYTKELQQVLAIEGTLERLGQPEASAVVLDLEAARNEVRERIARILEHGAGR